MKRWAWMTMFGLASVAIMASAAPAATPPAAGSGGLSTKAVQLKKLDVQPKLLTPQYQVTPTPPASKVPRYWYQLTLHFDTHVEWMDDLELRCYVLLKPKMGVPGAKPMLLRGDVTLVNVAKGKHKCDFFVHPSTLLRYGAEVEMQAVVASKSDQLIGMVSQPASPKRWWEDYQPVPSMVLKRSDTPWALINYDDCEQVKETAPGAAR